jgi:hypothetical protein
MVWETVCLQVASELASTSGNDKEHCSRTASSHRADRPLVDRTTSTGRLHRNRVESDGERIRVQATPFVRHPTQLADPERSPR